jgi:predicted metal-dependent hydrolase
MPGDRQAEVSVVSRGNPQAPRYDVQFGSQRIEYELVLSEASQLAIDVHPDRRVVVNAPADKSCEEVAERVRKKARWILRQLDFFEQFQPLPPARHFLSGESHYYLGRQYRLKVVQAATGDAKLIGRYLYVFTPETDNAKKIGERVELWYRQHARHIFTQRAKQCFEKLAGEGLTFPEIKLRKMPTRWGSYNRPGTILLNPDLVKAPLYCIEYVIVHELCHLKHPNHGRAFYRLLARCLPDWERRKERLELAIL